MKKFLMLVVIEFLITFIYSLSIIIDVFTDIFMLPIILFFGFSAVVFGIYILYYLFNSKEI